MDMPDLTREQTDGIMEEAIQRLEEVRRDKIRLRTILARILKTAPQVHDHDKDEECDLCLDLTEAREVLRITQ